jgi:hypothetical protein
MINKHAATDPDFIESDDEQRLQILIRQHERISREIIAIVLKTTNEAENLIQALDRQLRTQLSHSRRRLAPRSHKVV